MVKLFKAKVRWLLMLLVAPITGCYYLQAADAPMQVRYYPHATGYIAQAEPIGERQRDLIVMLPGMGDRIDRFAKEGLIQQLAQADIAVDAVVVNAHFGYYRSRSFLERLQADVLQPAHAAGYRRIHLAGVSLGGFGSLLYWRHSQEEHGVAVSSALLLTPYVGEPEYFAHRIDPSQSPQLVTEEKNIWPWLETLTPEQTQNWYIAVAEQDSFYQANMTFAELVPDNHVFVTGGGHNWNSWRELWPRLLHQFKRDFFTSPTDESP